LSKEENDAGSGECKDATGGERSDGSDELQAWRRYGYRYGYDTGRSLMKSVECGSQNLEGDEGTR
jgi:hypothetical protein